MISVFAGFVTALTTCLVFFFFVYEPVQSNQMQQPLIMEKTTTPIMQTPTSQTPTQQTPAVEIKASDITSLTLETVYKDFFEESSKCRKSYNELFGKGDGFFSEGSPCIINLSFDRNKTAAKSLELRRYDKTSKENRVLEKSVWKAQITDEQFDELAKSIANNDIFKDWRNGKEIFTSNSKIMVRHTNGTIQLLSNVDKATVKFLPMMESFRQLDRKIKWEKAQ